MNTDKENEELPDASLNRKLAELLGVVGKIQGTDYFLNGYENYSPTTDKAKAMDLLIDYDIRLIPVKGVDDTEYWLAENEKGYTPMKAIVKAVIALLESSDE